MDINKGRINIDQPRYDQDTFNGRLKYFFETVNPLNIFATSQQLDDAKGIVTDYRFWIVQYKYSNFK